ncbi:MAG: copper chaperone [Nitrosomonas sp. PRO4]|nr:copper chaperone [Nitrosomonas sp. PRO4]
MQTTTINIVGMTCMGCVNSVKTALKNLPGVTEVEVSLNPPLATIQHDPANTSSDQIKEAILDAGFEVVDQ